MTVPITRCQAKEKPLLAAGSARRSSTTTSSSIATAGVPDFQKISCHRAIPPTGVAIVASILPMALATCSGPLAPLLLGTGRHAWRKTG